MCKVQRMLSAQQTDSTCSKAEGRVKMYSGDDEQREIIEYFKSSFSGEKNVPKLLYGTGKITEILLDLKQEYNIVGVVDSNYNGKHSVKFRWLIY